MTLNELPPQAQTHSKLGAITNMPNLLHPTPDPFRWLPSQRLRGSGLSPTTGPRGCQLDWLEDAERCMLIYSTGLLCFLRCPPELCEL